MAAAPLLPAPASGAASPWWHLSISQSEFDAGSGAGEVVLNAVNLGTAPAGAPGDPVVLVNMLPQGTVAVQASGTAGTPSKGPPVACAIQAERTVACTVEGPLVPYDQVEVRIRFHPQPGGGWLEGQNLFSVSGGAPPAALTRGLQTSRPGGRLGIEEFGLRPEEEGGGVASRAGSHPFQVTAAVRLAQTSEAMPTALPRDLRLRLPPGLVADVAGASICPLARFHEAACPLSSVVGVGTFTVNDPLPHQVLNHVAPIVNLEPSRGEPARFGASIHPAPELPILPVILDAEIRAEDYSAEFSIGNISQTVGLLGATVTLWGTPSDPRHDDARGLGCLWAARGIEGGSCSPLEAPDPRPMFTLPTSCDPLPPAVAEVTSWAPGLDPVSAASSFPQMTECGSLPFTPVATGAPSAMSASSPSGLDLRLAMGGGGLRDPGGLAESSVKRIEAILSEGFTINPSAANGLSSCGRVEFEAETLPDSGCPDASKIGTAAIGSPIFPEPLTGTVYLGGEEGERFEGSRILYVVARNADLGLLIKLRAELRLDPGSGRVSVLADELPPLPLSSLQLSFPQGPRALLATPPECSGGAVQTVLTPYSDRAAAFESSSPLTISSGPGGGPCPGRNRPFQPALSAGVLNNVAGQRSPLFVRLSRTDGEAQPAGLSLTLPAGLAAKLAGLSTCPAAALAAAAARPGTAEGQDPSCPAAARIGRSLIGAGVGPVLTHVPGTLYLSGPHRGAPFSVASVVPARLGPFDLGTIVRRFPVEMDPQTGRLRLDFGEVEPLPTMLDGIALHLRDLRLYFDREGFILNPTSCAASTISGYAYAVDGVRAAVAQRFQLAGCSRLRFEPSLALRALGGLGRNGHPAIRATIRAAESDARIEDASFTLPRGRLLDFHNVRGLCARAVPAARCPASSRIGHALLSSPLLDDRLRGPIYLRRPGRRLPGLVADLRAGSIHLILHGETGAAAGGRLRISLENLPDLPLTKAEVQLDGGRHGLLVNSDALCGAPRRASAAFAAHNGKTRRLRPLLRVSGRC